ncbi:MAG: FAD-dependent monooxygenase [Pseudomonadota bacterium]
MIETPILIAGGGPVGLVLAHELNRLGVDAILLERNPTTTRHPKMDITNGRSMEIFRRLGLVDALRAVAVPEDHPVSVIWCDDMVGTELARFDYPSVQEMRKLLAEKNDGTMALEPGMRVSQVLLEPVLKQHLDDHSQHITLMFGWSLESLTQDEEGVTATIRSTETGETQQVRSQYLAGCDGAGSVARKTLGIPVNTITPLDFVADDDRTNYRDVARGEPPADAPRVDPMFMIHWESNDLDVFERYGIAWHLQSPLRWSIISQNDKDTWTIHVPVPLYPEVEQMDPKEFLFKLLGCEFDCRVLVANPWYPRLGLADAYGSGRVWLAGDSVHQVIPTGGYGMNTGVGDATALGWVLAANVNGWGGEKLFQAYENERRHVGARNRLASARHSAIRYHINRNTPEDFRAEGSAGEQARHEIGAYIQDAGNLENDAWGIEWGYRYDDSPVICHEDGPAPAYEWEYYDPSSWPGGRPPNVFLEDGQPLFDRFGTGFTLLNFAGLDCATLVAAAEAASIPLDVVEIRDEHAARLYDRNLVLIRPDQHVAWRGNAAPADLHAAGEIMDRVRGV